MLWACEIQGAQFMISRQNLRSPQLIALEQKWGTRGQLVLPEHRPDTNLFLHNLFQTLG